MPRHRGRRRSDAGPGTGRGGVSLVADAGGYAIPVTWTEKRLARSALLDARELLAAGTSADEAAALACRGKWAQWRDWVRAVLAGERSVLRDLITDPEEAADVTGDVYEDHAMAEALRRAEKAESRADAEVWHEVAALLGRP